MLRIDWLTYRYEIPDFDEKRLRSAIRAWVNGHGLSVMVWLQYDPFKHYWSRAYTIYDSKVGFRKTRVISLYVSYRSPILYVFSTSGLPPACSGIFEEVFETYAATMNGLRIEETPIAFNTRLFMTSPLSYFEARISGLSLLVHLEAEAKRVEAASEEVHIPEGTSAKISRARTITHAVEISNQEKLTSQLELGLKIGQLDILKGTVARELQRSIGRKFEQSETVNYEVSLTGQKDHFYTLIWADFMRGGTVEVQQDGIRTAYTFECRERTELQVIVV